MLDALRVENLSVRRGAAPILGDVSFHAAQGSLLAVTGPNGAGKSTLLKALLGLVPCTGTASLSGRPLLGLPPRERARELAYVPQRSELAHALSVRDVVAQARYARRFRWLGQRAGERDEVVERALEQTQLAQLATRAFDSLSGGEQRRVLLARALASEARVLLLDEPTAGLDVAQVLHFYALLARLRDQGYALVCVLHDLADVTSHADRCLLLERGRVAGHGATAQVLSHERLRAVYGVHARANASLGFSLQEGAP
jgi:iron complex transport system ATP-binding protein